MKSIQAVSDVPWNAFNRSVAVGHRNGVTVESLERLQFAAIERPPELQALNCSHSQFEFALVLLRLLSQVRQIRSVLLCHAIFSQPVFNSFSLYEKWVLT